MKPAAEVAARSDGDRLVAQLASRLGSLGVEVAARAATERITTTVRLLAEQIEGLIAESSDCSLNCVS